MIRLMIPVLLAVAVLGCQGQDAHVPMDPFYGQTKIAPPGTGEIARRPAVDPAYPRSAAVSPPNGNIQPPPIGLEAASPKAASTRLASSTTAASGQPSVVAEGDRIEIPVSARRELSAAEMLAVKTPPSGAAAQQPSVTGPNTATPASLPQEPQRVVQTLSPRDESFARQSSDYSRSAPSSTPARHRPVDINELPPVNRGAGTMRDDQVRQASTGQVGPGMTVRIPTQAATEDSPGRFAWTDDYSRLRGQLEYLENDRAWKLRYIPIDRKTDDFGGSVVIEDPTSVSGFERGDFVEVRGRIATEPEEGTNFAPVYHVMSIHGLSR